MSLLFFAITGSYAQSAATYGFTSTTGTYADNSGAATTIAGVRADTFMSTAQNIGFTFVYEGVNYTQFKMSSNGFISLNMTGTSSLTTNDFSAANATSRPVIAPLWDDLDGATPASSLASYEVTGVAPNRVLTVEWKNWEWNWNSGATPVISFQVKLYETTNVIEFIYRQEATAVASGSASIGIGSATGSGAGSYLNLTSVTVPAVSSTTSTTNINTKPATNQIFRFTPPTPCVGAPVAGSVTPAVQNICSGSTPANLVATGYSTGVTGITFQWEESDDDGATDAWAPAVGGTGATTAVYTPPAFAGTTIYYRLNVTCTNSAMSAQTASVSVNPPAAPVTQASALNFTNTLYTSVTANWTNGSGTRRLVVVSDNSTIVDPVDATGQPAIVANAMYSGSGQQIVYDGTGTSVNVFGLPCNATSYFKVFEYVRCGSGPYDFYYNVTSGTNVASATTIAPTTAALPVTNNFAGFTGANLSTVFPGWYESTIPTIAGNTPTSAGPGTAGSAWINSTALTVTTAKINLYLSTRNEWIISPKIALTGNSRMLYRAAITDFASGAADPVKMAGTDDKVEIMISVDGCGLNWTPLYTFDASNTATLTNVLTDYVLDLTAYTGQTVQIAFRATDGPLDEAPDYDFHITNINIELIPSCDAPLSLVANNVTPSSADITWAATTGSYEYVLDNVATDPAGSGTPLSGEVYNAGPLSPSTTYYFHVRTVCAGPTYSTWSTVSFTTPATPPANDDCANAITLIPGGVFGDQDIAGTIYAANTTAGITPSCQASFSADVWYSVTIPASGSITIESQVDASNSMTDSVIAAFSGTCGALTQIGCDDDGGPAGANNFMSILSLSGRTPGEVVYIGVWKYNATAPTAANSQFLISAYDASLSTGSFDVTSFKAYPNPVKDVLNLSYSSAISSVEVFNMLGQKVIVKDLNVTQGQVDMSNLNAGNYLVKVTAEGQTKTIKIIKQ